MASAAMRGGALRIPLFRIAARMFLRRRQSSPTQRLLGLVWPSIGWRRAARYTWLRLQRVSASPYSVAAGFACGGAIGVTPLLGLQFVLCTVWAWAIGGNVPAALLGTFIANPWTFPLIWLSTYELGRWVLGETEMSAGVEPVSEIDFPAMFETLAHAAMNWDMAHLGQEIWEVWFPMLVGSIPMMAAVWLCFYLSVRTIVRVRQRLEHRRKVDLRNRLDPC